MEIETPEQVVFSYTIAGIGSRAAAAAIDFAIVATAIFGIWLAAILATPVGDLASSEWGLAVAILATFLLNWGYYVLFEGLRDGQTPGKRLLGLRVVQDGGFGVTLAASAVRNLLRAIDMQPFFLYGVAIVSAAVSRMGKRLGDIAAGTIVVQERVVELRPTRDAGPDEAAGAEAPVAAHLTDDEYAIVGRFLQRIESLAPDSADSLASQLLARVAPRYPDEGARPAAEALARIHRREESARALGAVARGSRGAARERHVIVARGTERWSDFARMLAAARRRGLSRMSETQVEELVARYREVAADLARLRTASRGAEPEALFQVSRLVAAGHNLLYRQRTSPGRAALRYLTVSVPREIRRSAHLVALGALLLFGPGVATYAAIVRRPALAYDLLPPGMIDRAESARARESHGEGYLPRDEARALALLASGVAANNIQVTIFAFAGGIVFGLGTLAVLIGNGIMLGASLALFSTKGVGHLILGFVAPHGVLELSAICIAAAGGLHLAAALLLPGSLTRREALVRRARRAVRLLTGAAMLLVVAGAIEGFVSPRVWPMPWKLAVSAATAVLLVLFLASGRSAAERDAHEPLAYEA